MSEGGEMTPGHWGTYWDADFNVHVAPIKDTLGHDLVEGCVCGPSAELVADASGTDAWVYTHHSLDGREVLNG